MPSNKQKQNSLPYVPSFRSNDQGFSIIEVLIAMLIFSIGVLGVASMQTNALSGNNDARKISGATEKAVALLEELSTLPYDHASIANTGTVTPLPGADRIDNNDDGVVDEAGETGNYSAQWTIINDALVPNTKTIAVTITSSIPAKQVTLAAIKPIQ